MFHVNDIGLEIIKNFNNNHRVSQFKSSTQIIYKEENDINSKSLNI
jgi:hypothetical protein